MQNTVYFCAITGYSPRVPTSLYYKFIHVLPCWILILLNYNVYYIYYPSFSIMVYTEEKD